MPFAGLDGFFFPLIFFPFSSYSGCLVPDLLRVILWGCVCRPWRFWFWGQYQTDTSKNRGRKVRYKESLTHVLLLQAAFLLLRGSPTRLCLQLDPTKMLLPELLHKWDPLHQVLKLDRFELTLTLPQQLMSAPQSRHCCAGSVELCPPCWWPSFNAEKAAWLWVVLGC